MARVGAGSLPKNKGKRRNNVCTKFSAFSAPSGFGGVFRTCQVRQFLKKVWRWHPWYEDFCSHETETFVTWEKYYGSSSQNIKMQKYHPVKKNPTYFQGRCSSSWNRCLQNSRFLDYICFWNRDEIVENTIRIINFL